MKYLLDTHTLLWFVENNETIPQKIKDVIINNDNEIYVSVISLFEIAIKININKLKLDFSLNDLLFDIRQQGFEIIGIYDKHLYKYITLPLIHRDPFDRLLIATAISENMKFITSDKENQLYDVEWVWE